MTMETTVKNGTAKAAAALLAGAEPADALAKMLTEQMAAVHEAALRTMERAAECHDHPQIEALYLRQAARLMNLFVRQAEALDRRRAAAENRAEAKELEAERKARIAPSDRREAEERARLMRLFGPEPARRKRNGVPRTAGNGARNGGGLPP